MFLFVLFLLSLAHNLLCVCVCCMCRWFDWGLTEPDAQPWSSLRVWRWPRKLSVVSRAPSLETAGELWLTLYYTNVLHFVLELIHTSALHDS